MTPRCLHCRRPAQCNATGRPACGRCWLAFPHVFRRALVGGLVCVLGAGCLSRGEVERGTYSQAFRDERAIKADICRLAAAKARGDGFADDVEFLKWFNERIAAAEKAAFQPPADEMQERIGVIVDEQGNVTRPWSNEALAELMDDFAAQCEEGL